MEKNKEFAVLVGRAFLREIEAGHRDTAVAFGRAFLLSLGMKGPEPTERNPLARIEHSSHHMALAEN